MYPVKIIINSFKKIRDLKFGVLDIHIVSDRLVNSTVFFAQMVG